MTREIDMAAWPRRAHYAFFAPMSHPFYSLTIPMNVTPLRRRCREEGLPFYPAMIFGVTKAMEGVEAFLYKDRNGVIVRHDRLVPSFTDLKPGSDLFHIVTLEAGEELADFCRRAKAASAAQTELITAGPWAADELIYFTCQPWYPVTALTNERDVVPWDSVPRVSWGRWEERGDRLVMGLSLELNHRLLDGVHVGQLYRKLCDWMEKL